uniref:Uncharacterized protein n=1 Tax=Nelumbo nucifera TaxID=4432 RepID=A0A822YUV1_NELNU|nr:TPA_asm: hypothetical protein HUJ06_008495 [Nelumbo nucifera]
MNLPLSTPQITSDQLLGMISNASTSRLLCSITELSMLL